MCEITCSVVRNWSVFLCFVFKKRAMIGTTHQKKGHNRLAKSTRHYQTVLNHGIRIRAVTSEKKVEKRKTCVYNPQIPTINVDV
jgi:hypothetical protein